jgi:HK97 family phage portal protein
MWPFTRRRQATTDLARMQYSGVGGSYGYGEGWRSFALYGGVLPGTDTNWWAEVKDPSLNSTVHACLRWIVDNIGEPDPAVFRKQTGTDAPLSSHPVLDLLDSPNPEYDGDALLAACGVDYALAGDAYILKERNNRGQVTALWWKPYWEMSPRWPGDGSTFISDYLYRPAGRGPGIPYAKEDVIHIRWSLDAASEGRVGRHRTFPILREIALLNEAGSYGAGLLKNSAIPPYMFNPKDPNQPVTEGVIELLKAMWASLTRDNRGKPLIPSVPLEVQQLGLSPEQMALDKILHRPSLLVCAAFGIHPAVVNLATDPKGLDNGGQTEQARKQSYHDCLVPMLKRFGREFTRSLLTDFEAGPIRTPRLYVGFDFSKVQALQEDQTSLYTRVNSAVAAGWMQVNEAREKAGLKSIEGGDVFYRPAKVTAVDEPGEEVEPPSLPGGPDALPSGDGQDDGTDGDTTDQPED